MTEQLIPGFKQATSDIAPRLIVSASGQEKQGKTHFSLTAPGPIVILSVDVGLEGVVNKFAKDKVIHYNDYEFDPTDPTADADKYQVIWEQLKEDYYTALTTPIVKTIVMDTWSEMYDLVRLARFGKLTQVKPYHYGPVYAELREMVRRPFSYDKNVILLNKVKMEYIDDKATGAYVRSGFKDTGFLAQVNLRHFRDADGFHVKIEDCRQNAAIAGEVLDEPMCTFPMLAWKVFPSTKPEDWT